jgi:hypothetical protein
MSADQRRHAIAELLATAVLRLHARAVLTVSPEAPPDSQNSDTSERVCLDVSGKTGLSGHTG